MKIRKTLGIGQIEHEAVAVAHLDFADLRLERRPEVKFPRGIDVDQELMRGVRRSRSKPLGLDLAVYVEVQLHLCVRRNVDAELLKWVAERRDFRLALVSKGEPRLDRDLPVEVGAGKGRAPGCAFLGTVHLLLDLVRDELLDKVIVYRELFFEPRICAVLLDREEGNRWRGSKDVDADPRRSGRLRVGNGVRNDNGYRPSVPPKSEPKKVLTDRHDRLPTNEALKVILA
jgi:hypothetical protein